MEATDFEIGDFLLTHHGRWVGAAIRWGQRLRFRGADRKYTVWNHAALVVSERGDLVEALVRTGATRSHVSKYREQEYTVCRPRVDPLDQQHILIFAGRIVGEPYGWLNDVCVFLGYLTGNRLVFGKQNSVMCSELVARAQERAGAYFDRDTATVAPADLAKAYGVSPQRARLLAGDRAGP